MQLDKSEPACTSKYGLWLKLGLSLNSQEQPNCNIDNCCRIIEILSEVKESIKFDEFHQRILVGTPEEFSDPDKMPREWSDADDLEKTLFIQRSLGVRNMKVDTVSKATRIHANRNKCNDPKDWFLSLEWDKTPRINRFLSNYLGAEESEYTLAASKNWWIGMVARVFQPGSQVDNMIVLEGSQGKGKTSAMRAVGGRWHAEAHEAVTKKDFFITLQGKLLIEISELDAFNRAEVTEIKRVISSPIDRLRLPYDRHAQDFYRQCIFVGTTNEDEYLKDCTGGRRFWPIKTGNIDIKSIIRDREQLFAEACYRYKAGEIWHIMPDDITEKIQEDRRQSDAWEGVIKAYLKGKSEALIRDIGKECLGIEIGKLDKASQMRIARCLRVLGWEKKLCWKDGRSEKIWIQNTQDTQDTQDT